MKEFAVRPDPEDPRLTQRVWGIDQEGRRIETAVVTERPLTLFLNGREIVTMMTIGDHPDYLAVGYLLNQNMLRADDRITGIDYDEEAVRFARENYGLGNLEFRQGDVMRWCDTIGSERFHCVVTFDTIEHVPHREVMLQNLVEHLHDDGTVLLSTPCGRDENNLSPEWEAHRIEYSARSLYDFLRRYFRTVARPEEPHFPHAGVFDRLKGSGVNYWLKLNPVVCRQPVRIENPYR